MLSLAFYACAPFLVGELNPPRRSPDSLGSAWHMTLQSSAVYGWTAIDSASVGRLYRCGFTRNTPRAGS